MTDDLMKQALDAFREKDFDGARALLERVIEENPGDRTALSNLATLLFLRKETGRAEELFRRVLALEASHLHAAFGLAKLLISKQDFAGALGELQKVNGAVTPALRPEFYKLIGIIYVGSEDWETAVNFFESTAGRPQTCWTPSSVSTRPAAVPATTSRRRPSWRASPKSSPKTSRPRWSS